MSSQGGFGVPPYFQNNSVSSSYGLNGELPPEIAIKEQALNRKQQIANLLLQNGMKPLEGGHMAGRFYVPPSWSQGLEKVTQAALGAYGNYKVDQDRAALGEENKNYTADAIKAYQTKMAGTPEQPGQQMERPAQGPGAPEMASMLAMRSGSGDPGVSGKLPDLSAPIAIEGPQPTNTVTGPPTPAVPATQQDKQAAMMELLAKRIPGAQNIIAMQQQHDEHSAAAQAAKLEHDTQREFLHGENQTKIASDLIKARGQIDTMVQLGLMKADYADTLKRDMADQAETLKREMATQQQGTQREIAKNHDATQLAIAKMGNQTKENVAATKGQQKGQMPAAALKMQQEDLDHIGSMSSINADLKSFEGQIDSGKLDLSLSSNLMGTARNYIGASDENSRNLASFKATMEKQRNASLLLNKGVQTEGDAQRAWNELFANMNDKGVVKQRLQELQRINERAATLKQLNIDNIRKNYGLEPLETSGYTQQQPAVGGGASNKATIDSLLEKYK